MIDIYIKKAYKLKNSLIIYVYNDEKKNSVLGHLAKIVIISQYICFYIVIKLVL